MDNRFHFDHNFDGQVFELSYSLMTVEVALEIADTWKYPPPYDFYDITADPEDYEEFVTPKKWPDIFLQVRSEHGLFGFLSGEVSEETGALEIGLGMRPDLTGGGLGLCFMKHNLAWIEENAQGAEVRLSVASFNKRAIKLYCRIGFHQVRSFEQATNGDTFDFIEMKYMGSSP